MLLPPERAEWLPSLAAGRALRVGEPIAHLT